jgi:predicted lipoprotein with Yx(FWY)xxD motif
MIRTSVAVVVMGLVSLTACTGTPESRPVAQQQQESVVALKIAEIADLGPVVTDVKGFTLYRFDNDKPNESTCDGECAATWPPATVPDENFTVEGVDKVGSIVRKDGSRQLTVDGMPQYRFAKDGKPGETKGQGLQGKWFATGKSGERTQLAARTGVIAGLGAVLTNNAGLTLYRFDGDTAQPPVSNCDGGCAESWPPVYVEGDQPRVKGVDPKLLGTVTRKDGKKQLTVANWPQYTFKNDAKPGEAKGVTVPKWFATATDGKKAQQNKAIALTSATVADLGVVATDKDGMTLYRFDNDSADPPTSNCSGECAVQWPPAYVSEGFQVQGVEASLVGTIERDGKKQLTIAGMPQYLFSGDKVCGDANGQGVGGKWWATKADGSRAGQ